jgi:hypothetical protein
LEIGKHLDRFEYIEINERKRSQGAVDLSFNSYQNQFKLRLSVETDDEVPVTIVTDNARIARTTRNIGLKGEAVVCKEDSESDCETVPTYGRMDDKGFHYAFIDHPEEPYVVQKTNSFGKRVAEEGKIIRECIGD